MIVVRFGAQDGISGRIEASTTRNPARPLTAPTASTTAHGSSGPPIGAVDVGWADEARLLAITSGRASSVMASPGSISAAVKGANASLRQIAREGANLSSTLRAS